VTYAELNASITGYDDAEALAMVLERAAAAVRTAGGDPVEHIDQVAVVGRGGEIQEVFWSFRLSV
jgi:hypothetical protein